MEPDQTVIVTVDTGTGYTPGTPSDATVTIEDDDAQVLARQVFYNNSSWDGDAGASANDDNAI